MLPIVARPLGYLIKKERLTPEHSEHFSGAGFKTGGMQPRYLEGHVVLAFWDNLELQNPEGVHDEIDLASAITTALQAKKSFLRKLTCDNISKQNTQEKL